MKKSPPLLCRNTFLNLLIQCTRTPTPFSGGKLTYINIERFLENFHQHFIKKRKITGVECYDILWFFNEFLLRDSLRTKWKQLLHYNEATTWRWLIGDDLLLTPCLTPPRQAIQCTHERQFQILSISALLFDLDASVLLFSLLFYFFLRMRRKGQQWVIMFTS